MRRHREVLAPAVKRRPGQLRARITPVCPGPTLPAPAQVPTISAAWSVFASLRLGTFMGVVGLFTSDQEWKTRVKILSRKLTSMQLHSAFRIVLLKAVPLLLAAGVAACGGGEGSSSAATTAVAAVHQEPSSAATTGVTSVYPQFGNSPLGDPMPYSVNGQLHIFYLFDGSTGGEAFHPWYHATTADFFHYADLGEVLPVVQWPRACHSTRWRLSKSGKALRSSCVENRPWAANRARVAR